MAARDKIYGSFYQWCELFCYLKFHKPLWLQRMYPPTDDFKGKDYPLINLSVRQFRWLWRNCDLPFVMKDMSNRFGKKEKE